MTALFQFDMKGSLPLWVINALCQTKLSKVTALKEKVEKKFNKTKKRVSKSTSS
jgi:hypothetical protein